MAADGVAVLVEPAAVDQRLFEQVEVADGEPEACREGVGRAHRVRAGLRSLGGALVDVVDGVPTVRIFSASSSEISVPNSSSRLMISSTRSRESALRSSTNDASGLTSSSSTPSCSTTIFLSRS